MCSNNTTRIAVLCLAALFSSFTNTCAHGNCPCQIESSTRTSNCNDLHLKLVPNCISNSTLRLLLIGNKFEVLHHGQFERFKELEFLSFLSNNIRVLDRGCFIGLSHLVSLNLAVNKLKRVRSVSFISLVNLQNLSLFGNGLDYIDDFAFAGLSGLKYLNLCANKLSHLKKYSLTGLSSLETLQLNGNKLHSSSSFPTDVFQPLHSILELHLTGNCKPSDNCTYLDEQLAGLPSLKKLHIDGLPNIALGPGFAMLKNLTELYLGAYDGDVTMYSYCNIGEINQKTFLYLRNTSLLTLGLRNCRIHNVLPFTFSILRHLSLLDISYNEQLCSRGFYNLTIGLNSTNIKHLDCSRICQGISEQWSLNGKKMANIKETNIEDLYLSDSCLGMIEIDAFPMFPKSLQRLLLRNNLMESFHWGYLKELKNLLILDISKQKEYRLLESNYLTSRKARKRLSSSTRFGPYFQNFTYRSKNLTFVSNFVEGAVVEYNRDEQMDFGKHEKCIVLPVFLETIDVSFSHLMAPLPVLCDAYNSLKILNASHLTFYFRWKNPFQNLKNLVVLEEIYLSGNSIQTLSKDVFTPLKCLKRLILADNDMVSVGFDIKSLAKLAVLDVSYNKIQYLSNKFTEDIDSIAKNSNLLVKLEKNSLVCDCRRRAFVSWLFHTRLVDKKGTLWCQYQNDSQVSLSRLSEIYNGLETECIATRVLIGCILGFIVLNLSLNLLIVVYYKRWKIRYLLRLGRHIVTPFHPMENSQIQLHYDVYISYERDFPISSSRTLHEFVTLTLYPELRRKGFEVLIRDELDAGERLYNVISRAMRKCKRVIVLLSHDYCEDYWNVYEFNIAILEGIYTKRKVVIPVLLENIKPQDLQEELYLFLMSEPVPIYTNDTTDRTFVEYLAERVRDVHIL